MSIIGFPPLAERMIRFMTPLKETIDTMITEDDLSYHTEFIDMICTHCGHEEKMPDWCYGEEADYLTEIDDPSLPTWQCSICLNDTLVRKP